MQPGCRRRFSPKKIFLSARICRHRTLPSDFTTIANIIIDAISQMHIFTEPSGSCPSIRSIYNLGLDVSTVGHHLTIISASSTVLAHERSNIKARAVSLATSSPSSAFSSSNFEVFQHVNMLTRRLATIKLNN